MSAARRLFIDDGYEHTPMTNLARAAGVAGNTIYWYFTDKDDVLIAVLNEVMNDAVGACQEIAARPLEEQLLWALGQLRDMRRLVTTVHARIGQSPALNTWHDAFHAMSEGLLRALLDQAGATSASLDAAVKIVVFTIEGMLTHDLDDTPAARDLQTPRRSVDHRPRTISLRRRRPMPAHRAVSPTNVD